MKALAQLTRPIALATALVAAASCSRIPIAEPKYEGAYGDEVRSDTRRAAIYEGLETRLFIHVAWLKPELVQAQAAKISLARAEPPDLAAARLQKMQSENVNPVFFAVAYTPNAPWNDFDSKNSVWRIVLKGPAGEVAPAKITRYDGPFNAELISLYPYLDDFVIAYRLEFPPGSMGTLPQLMFAGTLGKVDLNWELPQ